jgi:hypothetical protein
MYLANPSTPRVRDAMNRGELGCILTPREGNRLPPGVLWCADKGCGPGSGARPGTGFPGYERYLGWLQDMIAAEGADFTDPDQSGCLFAVAPDVPGDAAATLRREDIWRMPGCWPTSRSWTPPRRNCGDGVSGVGQ